MKKKPKKHSLLRRVLSLLSCLLLLGSIIAGLIVGFTLQVIIALVIGLSAIIGPGLSGGGGFIDILSDIGGGVAEGFGMIFEAIGSIFDF